MTAHGGMRWLRRRCAPAGPLAPGMILYEPDPP